MSNDDDEMILVKSEISDTGRYVPSFEMPVTDEKPIVISGVEDLTRMAAHIMHSCVLADYDALVYRQMKAGIGEDASRQAVSEFRADRGFGVASPVDRLSFAAAVNADGEGFLNVMIDGRVDGQIPTDDGRQLSVNILLSIPWAQTDNKYYDFLKTTMGLEEDQSRFMVGTLMSPDKWTN